MQNSPRAERSRCGGVGRTLDVRIYLKQNSFVFERVCCEMGLRPEYTGFTFCATDTFASYAVSALQALPACTLVHLIILKRDQGITHERSGAGQQNLNGLVIRVLAPKRLISISATVFLRPWSDLLAD